MTEVKGIKTQEEIANILLELRENDEIYLSRKDYTGYRYTKIKRCTRLCKPYVFLEADILWGRQKQTITKHWYTFTYTNIYNELLYSYRKATWKVITKLE